MVSYAIKPVGLQALHIRFVAKAEALTTSVNEGKIVRALRLLK